MSKATDDMMDTLHLLTATKLADIIQNGFPVFNKETGEEMGREPAPAAYISAAIKFLKDNDITADIGSARNTNLKDALEGVPSFDEDDDTDPRYGYAN
jgi:hypothetical protein